MKKLHKKDWINLSLILGIILIYIISIFLSPYIYSSITDNISQHFRLPEYIRTLFYETKNFFPDFSFHLGAGQNIYNLTYYGLFNPLIILSYLFPYISMKNYLIGLNIILLFLSIISIYKWIKTKYNTNVALLSTIVFAFSASLLYHTHRHIMFVDYMLFQIIALINVEKYFKEKKTLNLILAIVMTILMSYYFSVGCIFAICIYAIYNYIKYEKCINIKTFAQEAFKFIKIILIPILLTSFVLLPTFYTLLSGRSGTNVILDKFDVLIPTINTKIFLYDSYSVGLTTIIIYAIIDAIFNKNKANKFLAISLTCLFIFPIFNLILNAGMYISGKCLIPFLPLCILLISESFNNIINKNIEKKTIITYIVIVLLTIILNISYNKLYYLIIDLLILTITLILIKYKTNNLKIFIPYTLFIITICFITNYSDKLVTKETFNNIENKNINIESLYNNDIYRTANLNNILENTNNILNSKQYTTNIYASTSSNEYINFLRNIMQNEIYNKDYKTITQTSNIFFNMYMSNKYLISDYSLKGYNLKLKDTTNAYINDNVFSVGYANNKLMSLEEFNTLEYPYTLDALMNYTIIDKDIPNVYKSKIENFQNSFNIKSIDFEYQKNNEHYEFYIDKPKNLTLELTNPTDKILIISFKMNYEEKCSVGNPSITINGTTNTLSCKTWKYHNQNNTFHYVISSNEIIKELNIDITKGHYDISDIMIYEYDYNNLKNIHKTHNKYNITYLNDEKISGDINVTQDNSYFQISIPYDLGFKIYVDNKEIEYEKINTTFIGFKIDKGFHNITIKYEAPLSKIGNIISLTTLLGTTIYYIIKFTKNKKTVE